MTHLLDARCAIFGPKANDIAPGYDENYLVPSLQSARSLVSVQWSSHPSLGLPAAPFEITVYDRVARERIEWRLPDTALDPSTGFALHARRIPPEAIIYIRGIVADADPDTRLFALDSAGRRLRETAQVVEPGRPFVIFGPTIGGIGSDRRVSLVELFIAAIPNELGVGRVMYSAPSMDVPEYAHDVEGQGSLDARNAAKWRLQGNTLARMNTRGPTHPQLYSDVHLADIEAAARDFEQSRPFREVEQNFTQSLADPDWSYVETLPNGADIIDVTVYPVAMLNILKAAGPIVASTFGYEVTAASSLLPIASRTALLQSFSDDEFLPFPIVKVVGRFQSSSVEAFARLTFADQLVAARATSGEVLQPIGQDSPATADADIFLEYGGWQETYFVERQLESGPTRMILEDPDQKIPKLYLPRPVRPDGSSAVDPWFSDRGIEISEIDRPLVHHTIYRRDEFGRWPDALSTKTDLPPFPVQPPRILSIEPSYAVDGRVDLELVLTRSWKVRKPHDIRIALVIGASITDKEVAELTPDNGVNSPDVGKQADLRIVFDAAGVPLIQYTGAGATPELVAESPTSDEPSYSVRLRLGNAADLFSKGVARAVVAVTADASNQLSGPQRRSLPAPKQVRPILDPRPPIMLSAPWQVVWSSRPNAQKRTRVLVSPPTVASGSLRGFRVWQASEAALIEFALDQSPDEPTKKQIRTLARVLKGTTDLNRRVQLLRNRIEPMVGTDQTRTAFFSRFDAVSDEIWPPEQHVEIELSSRHAGPIILLLTGVSETNVETIDIRDADLRAVAVPDRVPNQKPLLKIITNLDPGGATPNACLLLVGSREPLDPGFFRIFWDSGDEFHSEEELLHRLPPSSYFELSQSESRLYLEDIDDLIARLRPSHVSIFLLFLPESWSPHYLSVDILNPAPRNPADHIPSRRAAMISCFIQPGTSPHLAVDKRTEIDGRTEWLLKQQGLPLSAPMGYPKSELYFEVLGGGASAGPKSLEDVAKTGLELNVHGGVVRLVRSDQATFSVTAVGLSAAATFRLTAVDPTRRMTSVEIA